MENLTANKAYKILCNIGESVDFNIGGIDYPVNIHDLAKPENISRIYRIQFSRTPKPIYLDEVLKVISHNPGISLRFYGDYPEDTIDWDKLHPVRRLSIDLWHTKSLTGVSKLINLKELGIHKHVTSAVSLKVVEPLVNLETLSTSISKDIEAIASLKGLRFLSLSNIKGSTLHFLKALTQLHRLRLSLGGFDNFEGITQLPKLKQLSFHQVRGINDQTANDVIGQCTSLEALELQNLKHITSLNFLEGLPNLNFLRLDGLKNIETYKPVLLCKNLKKLSTTDSRPVDKDLKPLINLDDISLGDSYSKQAIGDFLTEYKGTALWIRGKDYRAYSEYKNPFDI